MRLRVELGRVGAVGFDGVDVREGFHAEFAVEAAAQRVEDLVFLLRAVPHVPLVHVADGFVGRGQAVAPGGARVVGDGGGVSGDDGGEDVLVDVAGWEVCFEPGGGGFVGVVVG